MCLKKICPVCFKYLQVARITGSSVTSQLIILIFPSVEWAKEGQPYLPRSVFASNGQLQFHEISSEDQGRYVCTASNPMGTSEATAEVVVSSELHLLFNKNFVKSLF